MSKQSLDILLKTIDSGQEVLTFLHNTSSESIAKEIMQNGFRFNSHLDYTTDNVSAKDEVTVKYFTITRQAYGSFTVIIQIAKHIIEYYSSILENKPHHFSEVLSVLPPSVGSDEEIIYQLAPQFVKGYIDTQNNELVINNKFDPFCDCKIFKENLRKILEE